MERQVDISFAHNGGSAVSISSNAYGSIGRLAASNANDDGHKMANAYNVCGWVKGVTATMGVQPRKYGAKELDRENGLDLYDSHARWFDFATGATTTQDPLAEKYTHLSPYLWCAANPIRNIDEGGDSIAVLYLPGLVGHLALLIQNDKGEWAYYSMNGNNKYTNSNGKKGGKLYHDLGRQVFTSVSAFLNSDYNNEGNSKEIQHDNVNNYGYEEAFIIPTTRKQDKKIKQEFLNEAHLSYNLINRQCAQVVQKALNAGGIKSTIMDFLYFDDYTPTESVPYMPASTFRAIRDNYPTGKLIKRNRQ